MSGVIKEKESISFWSLQQTYGRTELIDDVGNVVLRMKFKVARAIRFARAEARGHDIELNGNISIVGIVIKLSNQIFSEIGHVSNLPHKGIQDEGVRVGIRLACRDGGGIIARVVDPAIFLGTGDHFLSMLRIVRVLDATKERPRIWVHGNYYQGGIPVVDRQQIPLRLVNSQITGGCSTGIDCLPKLFQCAVGLELVGNDFSILVAVFGAGIDNVQAGVMARKRRVDNGFGVSLHVQEDQRTIRWVEAVDIDTLFGFGAARAMRWKRSSRTRQVRRDVIEKGNPKE